VGLRLKTLVSPLRSRSRIKCLAGDPTPNELWQFVQGILNFFAAPHGSKSLEVYHWYVGTMLIYAPPLRSFSLAATAFIHDHRRRRESPSTAYSVISLLTSESSEILTLKHNAPSPSDDRQFARADLLIERPGGHSEELRGLLYCEELRLV
jgi:hypothetical protein